MTCKLDFENGKIKGRNFVLELSPFVHVWKINNIFCLYHAHSMERAYLPTKVKNLNKKARKKMSAYLESQRMLRKGENWKKEFESGTKDLLKAQENIPHTLYLMLTNDCNLRCHYCYIKKTPEKMSGKVAHKIVDLFLKEALSENFTPIINFFGGKSLLNFSILKRIIEYINTFPVVSSFSVTTNGTLINDNIAQFFSTHNVRVGISLDGPKEINDTFRVYPNGRSSYHDCVHGIKLLEKHNVPYTILLTLQKHTTPFLKEMLVQLARDFDVKYIDVNLPILKGAEELHNVETVTEDLINAFNVLANEGVILVSIYDSWVKPFVKREPAPTYCGGTGGHIIADTKGRVSPCFCFTNINHGVEIDDKIKSIREIMKKEPFRSWSKRSVLTIDSCRFCPAIKLCGGGCLYNSLIREGTIPLPDKTYCAFAQKMVEKLVCYEQPEHLRL